MFCAVDLEEEEEVTAEGWGGRQRTTQSVNVALYMQPSSRQFNVISQLESLIDSY